MTETAMIGVYLMPAAKARLFCKRRHQSEHDRRVTNTVLPQIEVFMKMGFSLSELSVVKFITDADDVTEIQVVPNG